jgi:type II protein arginine methyltransferase
VGSYARAINAALVANPYMHFSLRLPIYNPAVFQAKPPASPSPSVPPSPAFTSSTTSSASVLSTVAKAQEEDLNGNWEMWDLIRTICDYHPRLTLSKYTLSRVPCARVDLDRHAISALDLTPPLPSGAGILSRWAAEPLRHVFLPASAFIANPKGYPVLPKGAQSFIRDIMKASTPAFLASKC